MRKGLSGRVRVRTGLRARGHPMLDAGAGGHRHIGGCDGRHTRRRRPAVRLRDRQGCAPARRGALLRCGRRDEGFLARHRLDVSRRRRGAHRARRLPRVDRLIRLTHLSPSASAARLCGLSGFRRGSAVPAIQQFIPNAVNLSNTDACRPVTSRTRASMWVNSHWSRAKGPCALISGAPGTEREGGQVLPYSAAGNHP